MSTTRHARQAHRELVGALRTLEPVAAAELVPMAGNPETEVVVTPDHDAVPPRVLSVLADHGFGILSVTPQGEPSHLIVRAR